MSPVRGSRVRPIESRNRCRLSFSRAYSATSGGSVSCNTVAISWKPYMYMSDLKRVQNEYSEADLKVVQTRTSSENFDDEFVELCLACEPNVFRTVVCRFGMGESGKR